ncbi:SPW_0924 family protein, partial [Streptomyces shaanxiensis]
MAGDAFGDKISTRAENAAGMGVPKVRIRFTIVGDTDATFAGGEKVATALTGASGVATAPALQAGETTGTFTVRTSLIGRTVTAPDYTATVTQRVADTLVRTTTTDLTCVPSGQFADAVQVKATYKGAVADKVAATATLIKSADDATENDKGPYFKDADGKTVRTLTGLTTGADGLLKLPQLYSDDTTGTFLLRITTAGGATLDVTLTVAAPATDTSAKPLAQPEREFVTGTGPTPEGVLSATADRAPSVRVRPVLISPGRCYGAGPDDVSVPVRREADMRALIAATTGLVLAFALILAITAMGQQTGG